MSLNGARERPSSAVRSTNSNTQFSDTVSVQRGMTQMHPSSAATNIENTTTCDTTPPASYKLYCKNMVKSTKKLTGKKVKMAQGSKTQITVNFWKDQLYNEFQPDRHSKRRERSLLFEEIFEKNTNYIPPFVNSTKQCKVALKAAAKLKQFTDQYTPFTNYTTTSQVGILGVSGICDWVYQEPGTKFAPFAKEIVYRKISSGGANKNNANTRANSARRRTMRVHTSQSNSQLSLNNKPGSSKHLTKPKSAVANGTRPRTHVGQRSLGTASTNGQGQNDETANAFFDHISHKKTTASTTNGTEPLRSPNGTVIQNKDISSSQFPNVRFDSDLNTTEGALQQLIGGNNNVSRQYQSIQNGSTQKTNANGTTSTGNINQMTTAVPVGLQPQILSYKGFRSSVYPKRTINGLARQKDYREIQKINSNSNQPGEQIRATVDFQAVYQEEVQKLNMMNKVLTGLQSHNAQNQNAPVQSAITSFLPLADAEANSLQNESLMQSMANSITGPVSQLQPTSSQQHLQQLPPRPPPSSDKQRRLNQYKPQQNSVILDNNTTKPTSTYNAVTSSVQSTSKQKFQQIGGQMLHFQERSTNQGIPATVVQNRPLNQTISQQNDDRIKKNQNKLISRSLTGAGAFGQPQKQFSFVSEFVKNDSFFQGQAKLLKENLTQSQKARGSLQPASQQNKAQINGLNSGRQARAVTSHQSKPTQPTFRFEPLGGALKLKI